jgi:hypothetical protein
VLLDHHPIAAHSLNTRVPRDQLSTLWPSGCSMSERPAGLPGSPQVLLAHQVATVSWWLAVSRWLMCRRSWRPGTGVLRGPWPQDLPRRRRIDRPGCAGSSWGCMRLAVGAYVPFRVAGGDPGSAAGSRCRRAGCRHGQRRGAFPCASPPLIRRGLRSAGITASADGARRGARPGPGPPMPVARAWRRCGATR